MKSNVRFLFFLIVAGMGACTFNDDDYKIKSIKGNPEWALPLATGSLTIKDILDKTDSSFIKIDQNDLVYLSYEKTLVTQDIRELINIPDLSTVNRALNFPAGNYPPTVTNVNSTSSVSTVDMGINPEKLTEIAFKSGKLNYVLGLSPTNNNVPFAAIIKIPEFTDNAGAPFQKLVEGAGSFSMVGYTFKSSKANTFTLDLILVIKQHANNFTVGANTNLNVSISMAGLNFKYIRGFFNDQTANPAAQTLDIGTFGDFLEDGEVSFAQPKIALNVINDYGVPLEVNFSTLVARKLGASMPIIINPTSPVVISTPASLGLSATTTVNITNVNQLFTFGPSEFYFQVAGRINKGLTTGTNFMADTSKMRVRMNIDLPLYGKASNISLKDTVTLDLSDLKESTVETIGIKADISNKLPLDATIQLVLLDGAYKSLGELLSPAQTNFIKGSIVNASGDLVSPGLFNELIELDKTKVANIFNAKYLVIVGSLSTSKSGAGQVDVKFKSKLAIDVKLGLKVKLKLKADL